MNLGDFKAYFYIKTKKGNAKNDALQPVYLRIEKNRKRKELSTNVFGPKELWNSTHKRFDGKQPVVTRANKALDIWDHKIETVYARLVRSKGDIELLEFYKHLSGKFQVPMLLQTFTNRIAVIEELIGVKYTASTITTYKVARKHLKGFLKKIGKEDIALRDITSGFLNDFHSYLLTKMTNNSANKNMRKLKAVLNDAAAHENFDSSKLRCVVIKDEEVPREYLTEEELNLIAGKEFKIKRIEVVRDIFLFQCYTGLAYADIKALTQDYTLQSADKVFIIKPRQKTRIKATVPLVPEAIELLNKYQNHSIDGYCFPVPSNQKLNSYLQEVADLCGINKPLTSHIGRHTFATRMLNRGMQKEYIQEIMGLSSIKHLNIYAKMQKETLHKAMMQAVGGLR